MRMGGQQSPERRLGEGDDGSPVMYRRQRRAGFRACRVVFFWRWVRVRVMSLCPPFFVSPSSEIFVFVVNSKVFVNRFLGKLHEQEIKSSFAGRVVTRGPVHTVHCV